MKIGLISCTKSKLSHRAPARDLYSASSNFRKRVAYVEDSCDRWFVLSAKHHLVAPDDELEPYEQTLDGAPIATKRRWSEVVLHQLSEALGEPRDHEFEIHAGRNYYDFGLADGLREAGALVDIPAEGLNIFELGSFYSGRISTPSPKKSHEGSKRVGPYTALRSHLGQVSGDRVDLSFSQIETILRRELPASARNHRAWWANDTSHSHALAWLDPGWKVDQVNLTAERVTFRKDP